MATIDALPILGFDPFSPPIAVTRTPITGGWPTTADHYSGRTPGSG
jgi:hypothetical protein